MEYDIFTVFEKFPEALPIGLALQKRILREFPEARMKVSKTQVGFSNRYGFAYIWPPFRRLKGTPGVYAILTFGLAYEKLHPRIAQTVEPYPGRWTHHVPVAGEQEIDGELMEWIRESYAFSLFK